jgi:ArsR family transcriptional regulator
MASIGKSLKVLADPTRLRLLALLEREELSVAELQEILGMGQSRISGHLGQLRRSGLLADRRSGKHVYYGVPRGDADGAPPEIRALVRAALREIPEADADQGALELALAKRRDSARTYFDRIAGKFGRSYCPGRSWEALAHAFLAFVPPVVVADLGAGEGYLSQMLARRARKVIAVDNSKNMVAFGRALARRHGLKNLTYRLGDLEDPPIDPATVDAAILSQALHHASVPQRAIDAAFRILKPGGRILILDLLAHTFEEARELYADLWLGFTERDLVGMLDRAGFRNPEFSVVAREAEPPHFQAVFATAVKP